LSIDNRRQARLSAGLRPAAAVLCALFVFGFAGAALAADFGIKLPIVKRIEIFGNRSFDDATLKKHMRTKEAKFYRLFNQPRYRRDFLRRDVESLISFYRANGFSEAKVTIESVKTDEKSNSVTIRLMVSEGPQTIVRRVSFSGQSIVRDETLKRGLKLVEGAAYNPNLLDADQYTLLSKFFERGYLACAIKRDVKADSTSADIAWTISPGSPIRIRDTRITGTRTVHDRLVRRELTFKKGELFTTKKIIRSTQNLYDTGYFSSVDIKPDSIDLVTREADLVVQVRERKMGYIETGVGVSNVYGDRFSAEWGQRNIFGTGNVFSIKSSYAFQLFPNNQYSFSHIDFRSKYMRHEGELRIPHVLGTWNTLSLAAFYERDATVEPIIIKDLGFTPRLSRRFSTQTSLVFSYSLERIQRLEVEQEESRSRTRSLDLAFSRDTRDHYFDPQRGTYLTAGGTYTGGFLGGDDNNYSLIGTVRRYRRLGQGPVLAYRVQGGYATAFGDSRQEGLPVESRFFLGGGNSVRGYKENSLGPVGPDLEPRGGSVMLLTNVEIRFPLPLLGRYHFGGAVFLDGGNTWSSIEQIRARDFRLVAERSDVGREDYMYGTGVGLRYYTPVGPLRLDVGFPLKRTLDMDYHYWVHISLGQIF
jgi:outer membrane protein insertion porin family